MYGGFMLGEKNIADERMKMEKEKTIAIQRELEKILIICYYTAGENSNHTKTPQEICDIIHQCHHQELIYMCTHALVVGTRILRKPTGIKRHREILRNNKSSTQF